MDHQRAFHTGDIFLRRHRVGDEGLESRQVGSDAFEDEIHLARQHVTLPHFRPAPRAFLEMLEIAILLAGQPDKDKAGDFKAQRLAVQFGVIALDEARLLQRADAAQAGWRGDLGAARQFHIGDAAIGLELRQYAKINGVQLAGIQNIVLLAGLLLITRARGRSNNISRIEMVWAEVYAGLRGPNLMHRLGFRSDLTEALAITI